MTNNQYDYIIAGAGCAGLSLLMRMMQQPWFDNKQILVIDQHLKNKNDRTWCFWEKDAGVFETIVRHKWTKMDLYTNASSLTLDLAPYEYKMIRGIDLYEHVLIEASNRSNITFHHGNITGILNNENAATVLLDNAMFTAQYVFSSIKPDISNKTKGRYNLLQHFKGWVIKTDEPCFDPDKATFMDFRTNQERGTTFFYVMPTSRTTALVEYTLFTEQVLEQPVYEKALRDYISIILRIGSYKVTHEEFGIIPMNNHRHTKCEGNVIYIGTVGGEVKGSSGYAFQFIQKRTAHIAEALLHNRHPHKKSTFADKKFLFYDSVLLRVLQKRQLNGDEIFAGIFAHNSPARVLQFLDNDSSIADDLHIMSSVPMGIFLPAAIHVLFKI